MEDNKTTKLLTLKDVSKQIKTFDNDVKENFDKVNVKLKAQSQNLEMVQQAQQEGMILFDKSDDSSLTEDE
jgi:hypothetical protein